MTTPTIKQLHQFMLDSFNDDDLDLFCMEYFPEAKRAHFGLGMSMSRKVLELIDYCERQQLRPNLLAALAQERSASYLLAFPAAPTPPRRPPAAYAPQPRNPRQIFVSHASQDAALAQRLAQDLQAHGYGVFVTPNSLRPGEKWVPAINRGLEESGIFLLLLTPQAVESRWVQDETNAAIALAHENEMRLLFLEVQPCRPPILWRQRQWLPFREESYAYHLAQLWAALDGVPPPPTPPTPVMVVSDPTPQPALAIEVIPPTPQPTAPVENSFVHSKTGLTFVRIPAGEFLYGEKKEPVELPEFWISKTPVTQAVYQRYIAANPQVAVPFRDADDKPYNWNQQQRIPPPDKADHPVVLVSWFDAVAFCEWAEVQLPTELQWEKAARGSDGRSYPWGNTEPTDKVCNFNENVGGTTPAGQYSPQGDSPYGCVDMSGNVWEWCLNKYQNPADTTIDQSIDWRILYGGSWLDFPNNVCVARRDRGNPVDRDNFSGFRVVVRRSPSQDH